MQAENVVIEIRRLAPRTSNFSFDEIRFVIDEIAGEDIVGHYVAIRKKKILFTFPPVRLRVGQAAVMTGVRVRTGFKVRY